MAKSTAKKNMWQLHLCKLWPYMQFFCVLFSYDLWAQNDTAIPSTKITGELRTRAAWLAAQTEGKALSYRLRLGSQTPLTQAIKAQLEFDHITSYWQANHSDGVRFNNQPLIPDAPSTQLNQAFINIHWQTWLINIGKQSLNLNNQRHLGGNGFWHDEQTFDALLIQRTFNSDARLEYANITKAHRITGPNANAALSNKDINYNALLGQRPANVLGIHNLNGQWLNYSFSWQDFHKFSLFGLDIKNHTAPNLSHQTLGASYQFQKTLGHWKLHINGERSTQTRGNTVNIPYLRIKVGAAYLQWQAFYERERLSTKNNAAFITPLASLHDFQGFTDQFLQTPQTGLTDDQLSLRFSQKGYRFTSAIHHFANAQQNQYLGKELDFDIQIPFSHSIDLNLRYGHFWSPKSKQTVQRLFLTGTAHF